MVRNIHLQRAAAFLATALFASVLLSGCVADDARTQLDWYPASDAAHRPHVATNNLPPRHAPTTHHHHTPPVQTASLDCPTPRAKPGWYTTTDMPPAGTPTTQPATYAPPSGTLAFAWPVSGPIISDYGASLSGERNAGINIATPFGAPIHAAASGQISYAGNELRGYGNLVLIKHDDGYVTAYAHAERIIVGRGDYVTKGQVIGYSGQTGDVTSPQLHFEIRKGVQPVNPRSLLGASRAT
jgi:murein DD-endopeptidase MepM/ murein hydrolase activator NlpD